MWHHHNNKHTDKTKGINKYLTYGKLRVYKINRGCAWLAAGTPKALQESSEYIKVIEERQGRKIGCIEEAAYRMGFIDDQKLLEIAKPLIKSGYGKYLINIVHFTVTKYRT